MVAQEILDFLENFRIIPSQPFFMKTLLFIFVVLSTIAFGQDSSKNSNINVKPAIQNFKAQVYMAINPEELVVYTQKGKVKISLKDGKVTADKGVSMDEAAKQFWNLVSKAALGLELKDLDDIPNKK